MMKKDEKFLNSTQGGCRWGCQWAQLSFMTPAHTPLCPRCSCNRLLQALTSFWSRGSYLLRLSCKLVWTWPKIDSLSSQSKKRKVILIKTSGISFVWFLSSGISFVCDIRFNMRRHHLTQLIFSDKSDKTWFNATVVEKKNDRVFCILLCIIMHLLLFLSPDWLIFCHMIISLI